MKLFSLFKKKTEDPVIKGIKKGNIAYIGPKIAQVDITNNCNLNCVGCWCHSDLMEELKFKGSFKHLELDYDLLVNLFDTLKKLGTKEIQLSGSGDPSMHSRFIDVVEYIKKKEFRLNIITNFTLLDKAKIESIVKYGVDMVTVSLWAGTSETYAKTHPNQTEKTFERIKSNLIYLKSIKKNSPKVKIYNVISSLNYFEINEMIEFALDVQAEYIEFQAIDTVKGKSEHLALSEKQNAKLKDSLMKILQKDYMLEVPEKDKISGKGNEHLMESREFNRAVNKKSFFKDFNYFLDYIKCYEVTCSKGFSNYAVTEDNRFENALLFNFKKEICKNCKKLSTCSIDKERFLVKVEFLSILGFGTFLRRISSIGEKNQKYDENIVDTMPCYIGWTYTRILPNGDVIPCCKAHKKPLGNINQTSFKDIWFSARYDEFRILAKTKKKDHPYFKVIDCYKSCDNVGMNLKAHMEMKRVKK